MNKTLIVSLLLLQFQVYSLAQNTPAIPGKISVAREKVLSKQGVVIPESIDLFPLESGIGKVKVKPITIQDTSGLRLHFRIESAPSNQCWAIQIKDKTGKVASVISASMIGGKDFWSDEIAGNSITVEIITTVDDISQNLKIKIIEIVKSITPVTPESITIPDQLESINNQSAVIKNLGKAVARLRFIGDDGNSYVCTAFLISRDLLLTNNHCINTVSEMNSALADFDYDDPGSPQTGLRFKELIITNTDLDFSLLRLVNSFTSDRGVLQLLAVKPTSNQNLLIIEHPGGDPKQISRQDCIVDNPEMMGVSNQLTDFSHKCDTKGGSSGSPVINISSTDTKVIGIHHLGFDTENKILVNRAVRIGLILDYIKNNKPSVLTELGIP